MITHFKTPTDFRKSLEARLKSIAKETNQDLQRLRRKVAFERLLGRVFHQGVDRFILKGGYAMELRFASARATKDIDLTCLHRTSDFSDLLSMESVIAQELRQLLRVNVDDYFTFEIGAARKDLENAPYGGARYSVSSFIDSKLFVRFQLDVGADVVVDETEVIDGSNWLEYCGITAPKMRMISVEQQLAEKIHAYSLPREHGFNSRAKDLVDILLLTQLRKVDVRKFKEVIEKVFRIRATHPVPKPLQAPPPGWEVLFKDLAKECNIHQEMSVAFKSIEKFYMQAIDI